MNPTDQSRRQPSAEPSEDELRRMLEAAERRRDVELSRNNRTITTILTVPTFAALVWAAWFLVQYQANEKPMAIKPVKSTPAAVVKSKDIEDLDRFRPENMRAGTPGQPSLLPKEGGQLVDKEDIAFAMQLLNFVQPPARKDEKKH